MIITNPFQQILIQAATLQYYLIKAYEDPAKQGFRVQRFASLKAFVEGRIAYSSLEINIFVKYLFMGV